MPDKKEHKPTWITEISSLFVIIFTIYQQQSTGFIEPILVGQFILEMWELATIAVPATILLIRTLYKKYVRK